MSTHLRVYRRIRVLPGVSVNIGKRGVNSISFGRQGAHFTVGRDGTRGTLGLPGSGLYLTEHTPWKRGPTGAAGGTNATTPSSGAVFWTAVGWFALFVLAGVMLALHLQ